MKSYRVLRAFATPTRKFAPGQTIDAAAIDGPLGVDFWFRRSFVAPEAADKPPPRRPIRNREPAA